MKTYQVGVVIGKFNPPHNGHHFLIDTAQSQCKVLFVLICWKPDQNVPIEIRSRCITERHPEAEIIEVKDELDDDDTIGWATHTIEMLGKAPDVVFSSEDYGFAYANAMGARHILVDKERRTIPCSGTIIRGNPLAYLDFLSPCIRAFYIKRICIVGAESTGKTTLAQCLSDYYKTKWVKEFGRQYCEEKWKDDIITNNWASDEFVKIALEQIRREDILAREANKVLICDTDAFATSIWHERYLGSQNKEVQTIANSRHYDLYLLTGDEIPFVQDGLRDGESIRHWMHERFVRELSSSSKSWKLVSGTHENRMEQSIKNIDEILMKAMNK